MDQVKLFFIFGRLNDFKYRDLVNKRKITFLKRKHCIFLQDNVPIRIDRIIKLWFETNFIPISDLSEQSPYLNIIYSTIEYALKKFIKMLNNILQFRSRETISFWCLGANYIKCHKQFYNTILRLIFGTICAN